MRFWFWFKFDCNDARGTFGCDDDDKGRIGMDKPDIAVAVDDGNNISLKIVGGIIDLTVVVKDTSTPLGLLSSGDFSNC